MKKIIILLLLFSSVSFGQTKAIKGNLITENDKPIAFANVVLQSVATKVKKGTTSNDKGFFQFNEIIKGNYTITIFYLGFKDYTQQITLTNENLNLKPIQLKEDATSLNQIEITVKKPTIIQKADKLIFNIENTILSNQDSWSVLNNTPSIFVNQDELLIKNNLADVYINDKKIQLPAEELKSFLEGLDGNTIKLIEVISNPSAKYDAQGNSIINIVLKKSFKDRYKGNVNANYVKGIFDKYTLGTSHFYKKNRIDITSNYSFNSNKKIVKLKDKINFFDENNSLSSNWISDTDIITENQKHNFLFNLDYNLSKRSTLSLNTLHDFLVNEGGNNKTNGTILDSSNMISSSYVANNNATKANKYFSYVIGFAQRFNDSGEKINTSINYSFYNSENGQNVNTDYFLSDNSFIRNNMFMVNTDQKINIYAVKLDYTLPLKNKAILEIGTKTSKIKSESDFKQFDFLTPNFVLDDTKSNLFLYDEINYALYTKYEIELEKFYYQIGLRGEFTDLKGNSIYTLANEKNDNDYFKLFPTLLLNYYPNNKHDFTLAYRKSINRPKYHQLNPFQFFFSDFAANVGNPDLKPAILHNVDFNYVLKRKYLFNLFYSYQKDRVSEISFQENETNFVKYINVNLDKYTSFGMLFTANNSITKRWTLFTQLFLVNRANSFVGGQSDNKIIKKTKFNYNIKLVNNFSLLKDKSLKASLTYQYVSPDISGPTEQSRYLKTNFSIQKSFFNNKAILNFGIDDIFDTAEGTFITRYENQDINYFQKEDTNLFKIGFRYNFGNDKLKENDNKRRIKEEGRFKG